jgi:predicted O-methyltransferase YrrM
MVALHPVTGAAARLARLARVLVRDPSEGLDRIRRGVEMRTFGPSQSRPPEYRIDQRWEEELHLRLGAPWPCPERRAFEALWSALAASLDADGLQVGLVAHDANSALARAAWCVTRHVRPERVVETGVARGVTSRFVLEGLERNGLGHLWSIDLPDLEGEAARRIGSAVPESLHRRWTYLRGASRRLLPKVCSGTDPLNLFIHDSLHSERNMLFEMKTVWPRLARQGVLIADDIGMNAAFAEFVAELQGATSFVASKEGSEGLFGIVVKATSPAT